MKLIAFLFICAAAPAFAQAPQFTEQPQALPAPHIYDGGWEHFVGGGVALFDCNDDTRPDLYIAGGENPAQLYVNTTQKGGDIRFSAADAPSIKRATGAYPMDIDSDGIMDLVVLRVGENILLRGQGECHFEQANALWGFQSDDRWTTAFTATWEAGQSWPTLVFGNYVDRADPNGPFEACDDNQIYRPDDKGGFSVPQEITPGFCALSMLISDWKRSGTPDLRISNDRHYYVKAGYEQMFSLSPLREYGADDDWPRLKLWGMGIASEDLTGDGLPEVFLTSMADQLLQINVGNGKMQDASYDIGTYAAVPYFGDDGRPSTGWHPAFGDVNNDGLSDLFIAKGNVDQMPSNALLDPNNLLIQKQDGTFEELGLQAGIASTERGRGAGLADLNGDGLLDLVVVNRRAAVQIWRNETPQAGHWVTVDLRQMGHNVQAVGAIVEVESLGRLQVKEVTIGGGHASGRALPLHFGLGSAPDARLRVIWPDGHIGSWQLAAVDQNIVIKKPPL